MGCLILSYVKDLKYKQYKIKGWSGWEWKFKVEIENERIDM